MNAWKITRAKPAAPTPKSILRGKWAAAVVYLFILLGALTVWMLAYDAPGLGTALLGGGLGAGLCIAVYTLPKSWQLPAAGGLGGLWLAAAALLWQRLWVGIGLFNGFVYACFTAVFHRWFHPVAPAPGLATDPDYALALFMGAVLLAMLLALAALALRSFWLSFVLSLPFFWFAYAKNGLPPALPTLLLLCGWCALLLKGPAARRRPRQATLLQLAAAGLCAVLLVGLAALVPATGYQPAAPVLETREDLTKTRDDIKKAVENRAFTELMGDWGLGYGTGTVGSRTTTRVNLGKSGTLGFAGGTAFYAASFSRGTQYYRGFSCDVYTGRSWEQSGENDYPLLGEAFQPMLYNPIEYLIQSGEYGLSERGATFFRSSYTGAPFTITYDEVPRYIHTPYLLTPTPALDNTVSHQRDALLYPSGEPRGEIGYQAYFPAPENAAPDSVSYTMSALLYGNPAEILQQSRPGIWEERMGSQIAFMIDEGSGTATEFDIDSIPDEQWEAYFGGYMLSPQEVAAIEAQQPNPVVDAYTEYMQQTYTQLPAGTKNELLAFAEAAGISPSASSATWADKAAQVSTLLRGFGSYDLNPGIIPAGQDFALFFLQELEKGYCVHYATAGTVLLRALGVPARYVEGYVMTTDSLQAGTPVAVPKKNAHAWVEVWSQDYGWLPLEVTPGGADAGHPEPSQAAPGSPDQNRLNAADRPGPENNSSGAPDSLPDTADPSSRPDDTAGGGPDGQGGGGAFGWPQARRVLLIVAAGGLLLLLTLLPGMISKHRLRGFYQRPAGEAVQAMYHYLERLARFGPSPSNESLRLANKARFSQHKISGEERRQVLKEVRTTRAALLATLSPVKKALLYLMGL